MRIKKAVIAVAGYGTRMLPATKALPKEMLTVVDKPAIQYIVEELAASGITDILMVTSSHKKAVEDHFDTNFELETTLENKNKTEFLQSIRSINQLANVAFVRQMPKYGTAVPILSAKPWLNEEDFVYIFADDLVKSETPFTKQLLETYAATQTMVMGFQEVAPSEVGSYGIAETTEDNGRLRLVKMIEKPEPGETNSTLASFGRFVLPYRIVDIIERMPVSRSGEFVLTDSIDEFIKHEPAYIEVLRDGLWLTTGDPLNWLKTNMEFALDHPIYGKIMTEYLRSKLVQ